MKILLLGEYSNLHWSLAQGLRTLGHDVTVVSGGDTWKNFKRDYTLKRKNNTFFGGVKYTLKLLCLLPVMRGFDVVQIINPMFLDLKADKNLLVYNFLRQNNKKLFLGANGVDHYWVKACVEDNIFRYSDFKIFGKERVTEPNERAKKEWLDSQKERINKFMADDCDGITCCLYEYYASYVNDFPEKTFFAPLPIESEQIDLEKAKRIKDNDFNADELKNRKLNIFIGIQKNRSSVKGTDVMERVLDKLYNKYPDKFNILKAISIPYEEYKKMIEKADIILDQIYSYTPAMNALLAMAKGIVAVSGGEPENYKILKEREISPIINVLPDEDDIYEKLEAIILNPQEVGKLSHDSILYVQRHHNNIDVAKRYVEIWNK